MTEKPRWGRAVAVMAGIAVVLVALVALTNRGAGKPAAARPQVITSFSKAVKIPDAPIVGPVALGQALTLTGNAGFVAQLQAVKGSDGTYTVDVRNLGTQPFDGTLTTGVWLATDRNMLIAPTAVNARVLTFPESQAEPGRPTELRITLDLGGVYPTGKWTLPSS